MTKAPPIPVTSRIVRGIDNATRVATRLVTSSMWFVVTPYPNDQYKVTVKRENMPFLRSL